MESSAPSSTRSPERVGKYRLIAELGAGGMAEVFLAIDDSPLAAAFKKLIVVKRVRAHLAEDPMYTALLLDEARISARLNHANVVHIIEVGVEDSRPYLAMEYLEGQALARIQKRAGQSGDGMSPDLVYAVVCDVLRGLHHAHELADFDGRPLNIVHRDVSPQNVFVTYDGHVKLLDFGIAKAAGRTVQTELGVARGKVRYMAPEQATYGVNVDRRADLFSVGILIWQAACGRRFWDPEMRNEKVIELLATGKYDPSPRAVCPEVPEAIDVICKRALAFDRADRYANAEEMLDDLEAHLGASEVETRRALGTTIRTLFEQDRNERRALLEQLSTASALSHVIDTAALTAATRSGAHLPLRVESAPESERGYEGATSVSLANVLEPTQGLAAVSRRRRRVIAWLTAFGVMAAIGIALGASVFLRTRGGAATARAPNASVDDRGGLLLASDGVDIRAEMPSVPSAAPTTSGSAAASASGASSVASRKDKPRPHVGGRPSRPRATAGGTTNTPASSSSAKPALDHTDPWR